MSVVRQDQYGFTWGEVQVVRLCEHSRYGAWLGIRTPKQKVAIRVTPKGFIRVGKPERRTTR